MDMMSQFVTKIQEIPPNMQANVVLVCGIPGSGKHRFGHTLTKLLGNENIKSSLFRFDKVQEQTKFVTAKFISSMVAFKATN
jgi:phage/plasmid-associated DNA primase